jgi:cytochrome c oxidase subunit 2
VHAPNLAGLYGRPVPLADGTTVIADERYVRDSILLPAREVAAGYAPIMPSFAGQISEDDILDLIAYIKSLADTRERPK